MGKMYHVERVLYPFAALVGQENMKLALILNAINPQVGGVLIRGEKGTGKSTAVRALTEILPKVDVVRGVPLAVILIFLLSYVLTARKRFWKKLKQGEKELKWQREGLK